MITVEVIKPHSYAQRRHQVGDRYKMREQDFAIMEAFGNVRRSKRAYKRRDMAAETLTGAAGALLLLMLAPLQALAQVTVGPEFTITWQAPTERTDGSPLDPADLGAYVLGCRAAGSTGELVDLLTLPGDTTTAEIDRADLFPSWGNYTCALAAETVTGLRSDWSNLVDIEYPEAPPMAPVITLTIR